MARLRGIELAKDELRVAWADSAGDLMQGLYARSQMELFVPPPVVDVSTMQKVILPALRTILATILHALLESETKTRPKEEDEADSFGLCRSEVSSY